MSFDCFTFFETEHTNVPNEYITLKVGLTRQEVGLTWYSENQIIGLLKCLIQALPNHLPFFI